ncbi:MAG: pentapeptide repeat-containing protein, partial [Rhodospirillaceae bacterium]|nr:pentapeptide repeat-containing protein [Rhodospirillaceae bacterium]
RGANLREADLQEADLWKADLRGADISGANFDSAKNLKSASSLKLAFYHQNNPPKNLEDALNGVDAKQRPMALTSQEYENVCRLIADKKLMPLLRDSGGHLRKELDRLRDVCDTRIDSQQQVDTAVNAAKAKFGCSQSFPTPVVIMFSQGFNPPTRAAWYGNGTGGKVLQVISNGLESLNHLVGRGSR